jgi:hypothetical protein
VIDTSFQVVPPSSVRRSVAWWPVAKPVFASEKKTDVNVCSVGVMATFHDAP